MTHLLAALTQTSAAHTPILAGQAQFAATQIQDLSVSALQVKFTKK